ncbi:MAG: hypothetical protein APR62_01475 [Smithella sp. SDB]|nr:MAG: hypothetical protein APR62_01475 [Smithella sp. SDB]
MNKESIGWEDISYHNGFIVDDNFIMCCAFCHQWHSYPADDNLRKGLISNCLCKCSNKRNPYYNKIIPVKIFPDEQMRSINIAFAKAELDECINYEKNL